VRREQMRRLKELFTGKPQMAVSGVVAALGTKNR
jgi:hypothetical protein